MFLNKAFHGTLLTLFLVGVLSITSNIQVSRAAPSQNSGPTDPQELKAFLDSLIVAQLAQYQIPGATVSVVKDGQILFAQGYGYSDLANNKPVIANQTLFRIGSVTKLFTWTSVMQLVQQGKLDLNADVNSYLKNLQIPATYSQPITIGNLMSHTAGFEANEIGIFTRSPADYVPLDTYVANSIPKRVFPPGEVIAYSNYGAALAGYVVEQVSGIPFDNFVETNILKPLGMNDTSTRQPLPSNLVSDVSVGYTYANGKYQAQPFEYVDGGSPDGSMSTTATDMAKFMIAHLQNGFYEGFRILQNATAEQMHSQLFTMDPKVSGMACGFFELNINGQNMIWHAGDIDEFHTICLLLPEQNVGLFASYNSPGGGTARLALMQAFLNHYYPVSPEASHSPPADFSQQEGKFTGAYRDTQMYYSTFAKVASLLNEIDVTSTSNGTLLVNGIQWVEVAPLTFRPYGSQPDYLNDSLIFRENAQGQITYLFLSNSPGSYERVPWDETAGFSFSLIAVCIFFFVSMIIFLPVRFFMDRNKSKDKKVSSKWARWGRWLSIGFSLLYVLFFVGFLVGASNQQVFEYGVPLSFIGVLSIALAASALAIVSVAFTVLAWLQRYWSLPGRLHYTLVTFAAIAFIWFLNNWNLLGFRF